MSNGTCITLAMQLNVQLEELTDDERLEIFDLVKQGYCPECGRSLILGERYQPCFCTRDE